MISMTATAVADPELPRREPGYVPLTEFARVRNPSGIVRHDEHGDVICDANGEPEICQRGEIISLEYFASNNARLLLENRTLLACRRVDWEMAPRCKHGRRFASRELAKGCVCGVAQKVTTL